LRIVFYVQHVSDFSVLGFYFHEFFPAPAVTDDPEDLPVQRALLFLEKPVLPDRPGRFRINRPGKPVGKTGGLPGMKKSRLAYPSYSPSDG
jgi:hypothetical protein